MLRGCGGGEVLGGSFLRGGVVVGGGSLFFQVLFLLLFLCLLQVSERAGKFSLGCIRHQIS